LSYEAKLGDLGPSSLPLLLAAHRFFIIIEMRCPGCGAHLAPASLIVHLQSA